MLKSVQTITMMVVLVIFSACVSGVGSKGGSSVAGKVDTDGDGYSDDLELEWGTDPGNPAETPPSSVEPDMATGTTDTGETGADSDHPDLANLDGSDGGPNYLSMIGPGLSALLAGYGLLDSVDLCVKPTDLGTSLSSVATGLEGAPFVNPTTSATLVFKGGQLTRQEPTGLTEGGYVDNKGLLALVPQPFMGCIEVYSMKTVTGCICNGTSNFPPSATPGTIVSITLSGIAGIEKTSILGTYARPVTVRCSVVATQPETPCVSL